MFFIRETVEMSSEDTWQGDKKCQVKTLDMANNCTIWNDDWKKIDMAKSKIKNRK